MQISPNLEIPPTKEMPSAHDSLPFDPSEVTEIPKAPMWETVLNGAVMLFFATLALWLVLHFVNQAFSLKALIGIKG